MSPSAFPSTLQVASILALSVQLIVANIPGASPPAANSSSPNYTIVKGIDNSELVSLDEYKQAYSQGYQNLVIRGYEEGWGRNPGGMIDVNFMANVKNALAAGYQEFDAFWFPCSGQTHQCASYDDQIAQFAEVVSNNSLPIGGLWLPIVEDEGANNWDYGPSGNLNEAMKMVAAIQKFDPSAGIYSSPGQWKNIFGAYDVVVNSAMALWWFEWDNANTLNDIVAPTPRFGGWPVAMAKQYTNISSMGPFNLNMFVVQESSS